MLHSESTLNTVKDQLRESRDRVRQLEILNEELRAQLEKQSAAYPSKETPIISKYEARIKDLERFGPSSGNRKFFI